MCLLKHYYLISIQSVKHMSERTLQYEVFTHINDKEELGMWVPAILECITKAFGHKMPESEEV